MTREHAEFKYCHADRGIARYVTLSRAESNSAIIGRNGKHRRYAELWKLLELLSETLSPVRVLASKFANVRIIFLIARENNASKLRTQHLDIHVGIYLVATMECEARDGQTRKKNEK